VWDAVGADPQLALTAKLRIEHKLQAASLGLTEPDPVMTSGKTRLADARQGISAISVRQRQSESRVPVLGYAVSYAISAWYLHYGDHSS
jgi:hypothetical protein